MTTATTTLNLNTPYPVNEAQVAQFHRDGYIKLKNVFTHEELEEYRHEITGLVKKLNNQETPLEQRSTYGKAFLQVPNLWTHSDKVKEFVFSQRIARIATDLLQTNGVRMYHDQALYKEAGGGYTPWHVDQFYWPLSSEKTVTAWIPLHAVPIENGPLSFAIGSQRIKFGRDLEISDDSQKKVDEHLKISDFPVDESPYDLGEVSFHLGFNFHRAGPNTLDYPREVMTVIYMDSDMRLAPPKNASQKRDWEIWCPGAVVGEQINTPLNPVLYHR